MVEAAFVTPVFIMLIFGIIEMGFLFRNYLTVNNAALAGARAASVAGDDPDTDFLIVRTVAHGLQAMNLQDIDYVVVYHAAGPDSQVPNACRFGSSSALECNRYTKREFFLNLEEPDGTKPNWACASTAQDRFWCPSDRKSQVDDPPDYVGVFVQVNHQYMTGFFGSQTKLESTRVFRIEPTRDK